MGINLAYAVVALFAGVLALRLIDKVLLRKLDLEDEIAKGNVAAAIFAAALVLFIGVVIAVALGK
jgi:uncharacterized membrane protein YjfL (UPF0719 family)